MTIVKFIVIAMAPMVISGCAYQTVNKYDIDDAIEKCGSFDNVVEISAAFDGAEEVTCKGGKRYILHKDNQ